ncbi:MAG: acyl carrier protein [Hyphomicrobiales bacterium]|nr:MAG: acyl carrier protein [Hyphomicrobiales bacterium]
MTTVADVPRVRSELGVIFTDVFEYDEPLQASTSPDDVPRWDSLSHIALVRVLEDTFEITLSMDEMLEIRSVADIEAVLGRHGV